MELLCPSCKSDVRYLLDKAINHIRDYSTGEPVFFTCDNCSADLSATGDWTILVE
jgi:transcription initiation factor IIE alpha subunit